jgi:hypothetical protein
MGALLASALKTAEPAADKKITAAQEKNVGSTADVDTKEAGGQAPETKSEAPKNEAGGATPAQEDKNDARSDHPREPAK